MPLDIFDSEVLSASGNAQDLLHKFYGVNISQNNAGKRLTGIRMHLNHKKNMSEREQSGVDMEEIEIKADGTRTTRRMVLLSEAEKLNPDRLMELMGYDPLQWELVNVKTKRADWGVSMKLRADFTKKIHDSEGNWKEANVIAHKPNYMTNHAYKVELTLKPTQVRITSGFIRELFDGMTPPKLKEYRYRQGGVLLELPILDVHLGKLAWGKETGEDYDMDIAAERYQGVIMDILSKVNQYRLQVERIIFPIGQDFFHFDNPQQTTTAGTQMDSDTRWKKMYGTGVNLLCWAIEQLRSIAPVECMYVPGNHDEAMAFFATMHAQAYFRNTDSVKVDVSPDTRKYFHYGKCLIGYSHGKEEGKRIEGIMQIEQPEAWADSEYREWHLGDLHHEEASETNGIIFRRISAITGTDAWHAKKAYKGSLKKAVAFIWDKQKGLDTTINSMC